MSASTFTVRASSQLPLSPGVNTSVSVLTSDPVCSSDSASRTDVGNHNVTVVITPGSVFSLTVNVSVAAAPPSSVTATADLDSTIPGLSSSVTVTATVPAVA